MAASHGAAAEHAAAAAHSGTFHIKREQGLGVRPRDIIKENHAANIGKNKLIIDKRTLLIFTLKSYQPPT